jgi:hypothetical protein
MLWTDRSRRKRYASRLPSGFTRSNLYRACGRAPRQLGEIGGPNLLAIRTQHIVHVEQYERRSRIWLFFGEK